MRGEINKFGSMATPDWRTGKVLEWREGRDQR
jgi:hypothetical protein